MSRNPQEEIFLQIKGQFKVAEKHSDRVKDLINQHYPNHGKLNRTSLLMIMKTIRKDFKREEWPEVKYMFKSIFVYIISDHKPHLHLTDISELIDSYPEFSDADEVEKSLLLQFRNLFNVACEIIDPKNHKGELIALVGRMCGAIYVTGGGQTTATDRRVLLYERETGIAPRKQPERKRRADDPATISLAALHHRHVTLPHNTFSTKVPMPAEINPILMKRTRYDAPDTQTLLRSADSFWNYHRALMETGEDIPFKTVPADQAFASFAYPSHDLPMYAMGARGANTAASHSSMRFMNDPLRRPQMPMSMQMQLLPARPVHPPPVPLPLPYHLGGARPSVPSTTPKHIPGSRQNGHQPGPMALPVPPRFDYSGYPSLPGSGPYGYPSHPGHPASAHYGYYGQQQPRNGDRLQGPGAPLPQPHQLPPHIPHQLPPQMLHGQGPAYPHQGHTGGPQGSRASHAPTQQQYAQAALAAQFNRTPLTVQNEA